MTSLSSLALWQVQTSNGFMFLDVELLLYVCCIPRSSSSPVIFFLVFSFLIYDPFFLLLFLFEVSPLSLCPIQVRCLVLIIVNRDLSSSTSFNTSFDMCSVQLIFPYPTPYLHFKGFQSCDVLLSHSPYFCTVAYKVTLQISVFTFLLLTHLHSSQSSPW